MGSFTAAMLLAGPACTHSDGWSEPGPRPQVTRVVGPSINDGRTRDTVQCSPKVSGGACPMTVTVYFTLPEDQFVSKAYVRFQGDGSDEGVDREYILEPRYGGGVSEVGVAVSAIVPPSLIRVGALNRYSVRLVTGAGETSERSTLPLSIEKSPEEKATPAE